MSESPRIDTSGSAEPTASVDRTPNGPTTETLATVEKLYEQLKAATAVLAEANSQRGDFQKTVEEANKLKTAAAETSNRIEAIKTDVEQKQGVVAEKSAHIEEARVHADAVRANIDKSFTQVQLATTNTEGLYNASKTTVDSLNALAASAVTIKGTIDNDAIAVAKLRQQSDEHTSSCKKLAAVSESIDKRIESYESELEKLRVTANARLKTIESLLPGATSAGLASAFSSRRAHFKWPQAIWQVVFVLSVLALLGLAALELTVYAEGQKSLTWDILGLSLLRRLPFALPLIWLAFHSSHQGALAQRVEEDYAFKETVSSSFEGFRREMKDLEGQAATNSALSQLCVSVLSIITNPPGRIYEKQRLNTTPLTALADSAAPLAYAASKLANVNTTKV